MHLHNNERGFTVNRDFMRQARGKHKVCVDCGDFISSEAAQCKSCWGRHKREQNEARGIHAAMHNLTVGGKPCMWAVW